MINLWCWLTCVKHLFDDNRHLTLQHGVQQLDDQNQAGAEGQQRQSQQNQAHRQVRQVSVHKHVSTWRDQEESVSAYRNIQNIHESVGKLVSSFPAGGVLV